MSSSSPHTVPMGPPSPPNPTPSTATRRPVACLTELPSDILIPLAGYLSQKDLASLVRAAPANSGLRRMRELTFGSKSFAPWRRRWEMFIRAHEAGIKEAREKALRSAEYGVPIGPGTGEITSTASIVSSGQFLKTGNKGEKEKYFEDVMASLFESFGFRSVPAIEAAPSASTQDPAMGRERKRIRLVPDMQFPVVYERMIFDAIERVFEAEEEKGYLRLRKLGCDLNSLESVLAEETSAPTCDLQDLLPHHKLKRGGEVEQCYRLLTVYLFYTSLTPQKIPRLVRHATPKERREMMSEAQDRAIVEYFCFLGLWLDLWEAQSGMVRWRGPPPVGKTTIFDAQCRRVLTERLKDYVRITFAPGRPRLGESIVPAVAGRRGTMTPQKRSASDHVLKAPMSTPMRPQRSLSNDFASTSSSWNTVVALTGEQQQVVNTDVARGELMKVRAYAGTGKTRSLVEYARIRPDRKFLYVVFNKSAQMDAELKFGPNVDCKTAHALALQALEDVSPRVHAAKTEGRMPIPSHWGNKDIVDLLMLNDDKVIRGALVNPDDHVEPGRGKKRTTAESERAAAPGYHGSQDGSKKPWPTATSVAQTVRKGLEGFWASDDLAIQEKCLPTHMIEKLGLKTSAVFEWVRGVWRDILNGRAPWLPHDAYLKLLHLYGQESGGDLRVFGAYDIIMFDEAQDANPCMASIILRQHTKSNTGVIVVGDPYQRIYGFRGAGNEAFDDAKFPPVQTHYLTWSFRFGDEVASVANILLRAMGEQVPVNGAREVDMVRAAVPQDKDFGLGDPDYQPLKTPRKQFTVIFRKNVTLIEYAIAFSLTHPNHKLHLRIQRNFQKNTLFQTLREAFVLLHFGHTAKSHPLKAWKSWTELKAHVEAEAEEGGAPDSPILTMVVMLESRLKDPFFLDQLDQVEANVLSDDQQHLADVILITAHQAKGLEWDHVQVAADFAPDYGKRHLLEKTKFWREEACILYVALTRARKILLLDQPLREWIAGERGWSRHYLWWPWREPWKRICCRPDPRDYESQEALEDDDPLWFHVLYTEDVLGYATFAGNPKSSETVNADSNADVCTLETHHCVGCLACFGGVVENGDPSLGATNFTRACAERLWWLLSRPDDEPDTEPGKEELRYAERLSWDEVWRLSVRGETDQVGEWCQGSYWEPWTR